MIRPRLLDLFCGQGGAGVGYAAAGFEVVGVDLAPQPRYPMGFVRADALDYLASHGSDFDAIHASPPCQAYAPVTAWRGDPLSYPDLLASTREGLQATGRPWIIENVPGAPLRADFLLCGTMFGLRFRRHRLFETSWRGFALVPTCAYRTTDAAFDHSDERAYADALGCSWMSVHGGRQAIPPAYTQFLGEQLLDHLTSKAA